MNQKYEYELKNVFLTSMFYQLLEKKQKKVENEKVTTLLSKEKKMAKSQYSRSPNIKINRKRKLYLGRKKEIVSFY